MPGNQSFVFLVSWTCLTLYDTLTWGLGDYNLTLASKIDNCTQIPTLNLSAFAQQLLNEALGNSTHHGGDKKFFDNWGVVPGVAAGVLLSALLVFVFMKSRAKVFDGDLSETMVDKAEPNTVDDDEKTSA
jgi:hypothetical protein